MSMHESSLIWELGGGDFSYSEYSRNHKVTLGCGKQMEVSAAPEFLGDGGLADPEELLVAAASSCHMMSFLAIASRKRLWVEKYTDHAVGHLEKDVYGSYWISRIELHPHVTMKAVDLEKFESMHRMAHTECFISRSLKTKVIYRPVLHEME